MILKMKRCLNENFCEFLPSKKAINQLPLKKPTHYSEICKTKGKNQAFTLVFFFFPFGTEVHYKKFQLMNVEITNLDHQHLEPLMK